VQELKVRFLDADDAGKTTGHRPPPATMAKPNDVIPWSCLGRWK